jgi:hypothetical protein
MKYTEIKFKNCRKKKTWKTEEIKKVRLKREKNNTHRKRGIKTKILDMIAAGETITGK